MRACLLSIIIVAAVQAEALGANILHFTSSPSSWVGQGQTEWFTSANGYSFSGFRYFSQGAYSNAASFSVKKGSEYWSLDFVGPDYTFATPGHYADALRWPFHDDHPGLSFSGDGRGNNKLTGEFTVYEIEYSGTALTKLAIDFVQFDEGVERDWVRGSLRFNSNLPIPIPEPSTLAMLLVGGAGLVVCRRRRRAS